MRQPSFHQFLCHNPTERFDVQGPTLGKVFNAPGFLSRTPRHILTTPGDFLLRRAGNLLPRDCAAAGRAFAVHMGCQVKGFRICNSRCFNYFHYLWNHHARFADHDGIAYSNVFAPNLILVMESCP